MSYVKRGAETLKIRRIFALIISVVILGTAIATPLSAFATVTADTGELQVLPGNTQSSSPSYSMAWLDNIIIRDDASAITAATVIPRAEYPYSKTYEEFIREVNHFSLLNTIDEKTVEESYDTILEVLYYMVTAVGMTDNQDIMRGFLTDYGIKLPANPTAKDNIKMSVVYAALKYNAIYVLYNKPVEFSRGLTLDAAAVVILSAVTGVNLPSGINTVSGFGVLCVKNYVEEFEQLPISKNPDNSEIFHWAKILTAASNDYEVPLVQYDLTTQAQKDYVDYAYYASILKTIYDVDINPIYLVMADQNPADDSVASLILRTMLDEKSVAYDSNSSSEKLFKLACENGYFQLDNEFYSDVFNYDIDVDKKCEKLWFTPFALADQLEGSNQYVSIMLGDKKMVHAATAYAPLDPSKPKETVTLTVNYDDGKGKVDTVTYKFNVTKVTKQNTATSENETLNKIQQAVNNVIPQNNGKASEYVNEIFSSIDSKLTTSVDEVVNEATTKNNILSTYPQEDTNVTQKEKTSDGIDFDYLDELFSNTYPTDENGNIITTKSLESASKDEDAGASFVEKTVAAIKENPEAAVAAPTSIIAVGGILGYIFSKKRKSAEIVDETANEETEE